MYVLTHKCKHKYKNKHTNKHKHKHKHTHMCVTHTSTNTHTHTHKHTHKHSHKQKHKQMNKHLTVSVAGERTVSVAGELSLARVLQGRRKSQETRTLPRYCVVPCYMPERVHACVHTCGIHLKTCLDILQPCMCSFKFGDIAHP